MIGSYLPSSSAGRGGSGGSGSGGSGSAAAAVEPIRFSSYLRSQVFGRESLDISRAHLDRRAALSQHTT